MKTIVLLATLLSACGRHWAEASGPQPLEVIVMVHNGTGDSYVVHSVCTNYRTRLGEVEPAAVVRFNTRSCPHAFRIQAASAFEVRDQFYTSEALAVEAGTRVDISITRVGLFVEATAHPAARLWEVPRTTAPTGAGW